MSIKKNIEAFAATISEQPIGLVQHRPEPWGRPTQCFGNVVDKMARSGGSGMFGWFFLHRVVADIPGPGYLIATHHAVWHSPDGSLIDVTPFAADPKHHPYGIPGNIVFLVDMSAIPAKAGTADMALPNRFHPLTAETRLVRHVEQLRLDEARDWAAACKAARHKGTR